MPTNRNNHFSSRRFMSTQHVRNKPRKLNYRLIFRIFAYFLLSFYVFHLWFSEGELVEKRKNNSKVRNPMKREVEVKVEHKGDRSDKLIDSINETKGHSLNEDKDKSGTKNEDAPKKSISSDTLKHSANENEDKPGSENGHDENGHDENGHTLYYPDDKIEDKKNKSDKGVSNKSNTNVSRDDDHYGKEKKDLKKIDVTSNGDEASTVMDTGSLYRRLGKGDETGVYGKIKSISIIGERNSGTTWLFDHLMDCYEGLDVSILRRLTRYKHWFQYENEKKKAKTGTLLITMYRNVYDWSRAMIATPHHAPAHMDLEWKEFLTKPWTMERVGKDLDITEDEKSDPNFCQQGFQYKDVISCHVRPYPAGHFKTTRFSEHQPFYEMRNDGSGEPYDNILEMRADKIRHFSSLVDYKNVEDSWIVHYEDLLHFGTKELLEKLWALTGIQPDCEWSPPQLNRKKRKIDPEMIEFLNHNVDWEVEKSIGYEQREMPLEHASPE